MSLFFTHPDSGSPQSESPPIQGVTTAASSEESNEEPKTVKSESGVKLSSNPTKPKSSAANIEDQPTKQNESR